MIAYRDGVMAADSASWRGPVMVAADARKITRLADGTLIGCCGDVGEIGRVTAWLADQGRSRTPPRTSPEFAALVVRPDGAVEVWSGKPLESSPMSADGGVCIGMAEEFVMGLLATGMSAADCVRVAIERVAYVGGSVTLARSGEVSVAGMLADEPETDDAALMETVRDLGGRRWAWRDHYGIGDTVAVDARVIAEPGS